jgi:hypothetical protein
VDPSEFPNWPWKRRARWLRWARFLASSEPEVLCIRGKWGVGKTYAWRTYVEEAKDRPGGIALPQYSYVTLFGVQSIEELKYAIWESKVSAKDIGTDAAIENLQDNAGAVLKRGKTFISLLVGCRAMMEVHCCFLDRRINIGAAHQRFIGLLKGALSS